MRLWWLLCARAWREQPGRIALAVLAVMLGVALAFGVHLLNGAALLEFSRAAQSVNGQPDAIVSARSGPLHDADLSTLLTLPEVAGAVPVIEGQARWLDVEPPRPLRLIGLDGLALLGDELPLAPDLLPHSPRWQDLVSPDQLHLNPAASALFEGRVLRLRLPQPGAEAREFSLGRGADVAAAGAPLAVLDVAAAQALLGRVGELDRVLIRLRPGAALPALPAHLKAEPPADEASRLNDLTRAYRVNLGLLSLMALFTGSFLVFAVLSLSAAQRLPQWALVGVLGLSSRQRLVLLLAEGGVIGGLGSVLGLMAGFGFAALALRLLGSDLGLQAARGGSLVLLWQQPLVGPALSYGALGLAATLAAALGPALAVRRIAPAQVLKGLGTSGATPWPAWTGLVLLGAGWGLAHLPPLAEGLPLAAYAAMLCLLLGGLALVPPLVSALGRGLAALPAGPRVLLACERSRDQADEARRSLAGVLVALALSVAMVVMIGSFRDSLQAWLDQVLPADLYLRSALRSSPGQVAPLPDSVLRAAQASGATVHPQRSTEVWVDGGAEPLSLIARKVDEARSPFASRVAATQGPVVYLNEAARDRLGLAPGQTLSLSFQAGGRPRPVQVRAIWRDYARQSPALWMPLADYRALSGDTQTTELALEGGGPGVRKALQALPDIELASSAELRTISLQIFDRSFAITVWLQGVALAVGLFGVAAGQSAQALARQREFGLLRHLGFARRELQGLLLLEASLMAGAGVVAGLALGLLLAAVLVFVVNPQSFHWSMDLHLPWARLAALMAVAFVAAVGAATLAGRRALGADAIRAVKEDW